MRQSSRPNRTDDSDREPEATRLRALPSGVRLKWLEEIAASPLYSEDDDGEGPPATLEWPRAVLRRLPRTRPPGGAPAVAPCT